MCPAVNINFEPVPEVTPTGAPGNDYFHIQGSPAAFGAAGAEGLEKLGQGLERSPNAGYETLQFYDRVAADQAVNNYIDQRTKIEYGDPTKTVTGPDGQPTKDTGYFGQTGAAAMHNQQPALQALQQARQSGLDSLSTPNAKLLYDTETRRMYTDSQMRMSAHADQQQKVWASSVNKAGADINLNGFAAAITDPARADEADGFYHRYIDAKVKNVQLATGNDPTATQAAVADAKRDLAETQANAIAVKDPAAALDFVSKNKDALGTRYDDVSNRLRARAENQTASGVANREIQRATAYPHAEVQNVAAGAWRNAGMSQNGVAGVLFNINEESSFNPNLRHYDQPRYSAADERGYAHGLYQEGAEEWSNYEKWISANHPGADWRDPQMQSDFAAWNLKTNYPGTWARMNAAGTPQEAAAIYAREYLKPSDANLQTRLEKIGQGGIMPAAAGVAGGSPGAPPMAPNRYAQLSDALRGVDADPNLSDRERQLAVSHIEQQFRTLEIEDNQTAKAKKDASDNAAGGYITKITDGVHTPGFDFVALEGQINRDPNLTWETKAHLLDRVGRFSGEEQAVGYGTGYFDAKARILSPAGTPGHIGSVDDILQLPPNSITRSGERELVSIFNDSKKQDQASVQEAKHGVEQSVMLKMVRPDETGGFIKDIKGQQLFNGKFLPMFTQEYDKWVAAGKDPYEFLRDEKKINGLMEMAYPQKERNADKINAVGELPTAPEGIAPEPWKAVVSAPPSLASGEPMPMKNWASAVSKLVANPSPQMMEAFDRHVADTGVTARGILGALNPAALIAIDRAGEIKPPEAQPAAAPTAPAAAAPPAQNEMDNPSNPAVRFRSWIERGLHPEQAKEPAHTRRSEREGAQ